MATRNRAPLSVVLMTGASLATATTSANPSTPPISEVASHSCFAGQIEHPDKDRIAESTVFMDDFMHDRAPNAKHSYGGSGVIIANSSDKNGNNRIVTAQHFAADPQKEYAVITSDGTIVGFAKVVASGSSKPTTSFTGPKEEDISVLEMTKLLPNKQGLYKSIQGLHIAPQQSDRLLTADFSKRPGPQPGESGGPVVNEKGQVVGILIGSDKSASSFFGLSYKMTAPNIELVDPKNPSAEVKDKKDFVPISNAYILPLNNGKILDALGDAGQDIEVVPSRETLKSATFAGFPQSLCMSFEGDLSPDPDAPATPNRHSPSMAPNTLAK